jgi:urease accessory protein
MVAVGIFAIFHGYAHGEEIPTVAEPIPYVSGFMMGTVLLHVSGLILADISTHYKSGKIILRIAGLGIALSGLYFLISAFS